MGDPERGLYQKFYRIRRRDGRSAQGQKHDECEYFVLDLTHDPYALEAILTYSEMCHNDFPLLARDLRDKVRHAPRMNPPGAGRGSEPGFAKLDQETIDAIKKEKR